MLTKKRMKKKLYGDIYQAKRTKKKNASKANKSMHTKNTHTRTQNKR